MLIGTVVGAASAPAEGQPCPAVPPCGACVEDVGSATCKPRPKPKHTARAISLSAHGGGTCALLDDGSLRCWGVVAGVDLGRRPVKLPAPRGAVTVALGGHHACVRTRASELWCWGKQNAWRAYDHADSAHARPVKVKDARGVRSFVLGAHHTAWLHGAGIEYRGSGFVDLTLDAEATRALQARGVAQLVSSPSNSRLCAATGDRRAVCWGVLPPVKRGEDVSARVRRVPTEVADLDDVVEVATSGDHDCARRADGTVRCWGMNGGRLGDEHGTASGMVKVEGVTGAVALATGPYHTCARTADGRVACWGHFSTLLGSGTGLHRRGVALGDAGGGYDYLPVFVPDLADVVEIALGAYHACARIADGKVACWGWNEYGTLGDGTTIDRTRPVVIPW